MSKTTDSFISDLSKLIDEYRDKYTITYAEMVGCIELIKSDLINELRD